MKQPRYSPEPKMLAMRAEQHAEYDRHEAVARTVAAGRTCGGCRDFRGDHCATQTLQGALVVIDTPSAVACVAWKDAAAPALAKAPKKRGRRS